MNTFLLSDKIYREFTGDIAYEDYDREFRNYDMTRRNGDSFRIDPICIGVDLETNGLDPRRDSVKVITIHSPLTGFFYVIRNPSRACAGPLSKPWYQHLLGQRKPVFHFARFDVSFLATLGLLPLHFQNGFHCTKTLSRIVRTYSPNHGYASCVKDLLGIEIEKAEQCSDWGADMLTHDQVRYLVEDVRHLQPLLSRMLRIAEREDRESVYNRAMKILDNVVSLDASGWDYRDLMEHGGAR